MKKIFLYIYFVFVIVLNFGFFNIHSLENDIKYFLPEEYEPSKEDLEIIFIDIGQGDCILVITPYKKNLLIDAGGVPYWMDSYSLEPGKDIVVPYLLSKNIKILDFVIVTHPHGDHFGGMFAVLNFCIVKSFIDNGYLKGDPNYKDLLEIVDKQKIPYDQLKEGDFFEIDKDVSIHVFFPPKKGFIFEDANNSSLVFKLVYKDFSILLTGDIEVEAESYICSKYKNTIKSLILKVPHHGSRTSSGNRFIKAVSPEAAIIMCGKNNLFGHPHNEVISRYIKFKVDLYRTDIDGNIRIVTDGHKYTIIPSSK